MLKKVKDFMQENEMFSCKDRVVVGVSGGPDSVCLLFLLLEYQKEIPFELVVVHVNHGLRGEFARRDEEYVINLCENLRLPYEIVREDVAATARKRKLSVEEAGREVRRKAFYDVMHKYNGTKIALAHHKNDNVETMLMNLARGSALKGLTGMRPANGEIVRPLLCLEREEIERYLKERNIPYCIDETNGSDDYTRNRVRNQILPLFESMVNEKAISHMSETMELLDEVEAYLEEETNCYYAQVAKESEEGVFLFEQPLNALPQLFQRRIIQKALSFMANGKKDLQKNHIDAVRELCKKQTGRRISLPYHLEAKRVYEGILISKGTQKEAKKVDVKLPDNVPNRIFVGDYSLSICEEQSEEWKEEKKCTKCFDCAIMNTALRVRTRMPGDYITIDKSGRTKKLKEYFIHEKIPQEKRDRILLLAEGNHVLWVIGYRRGCAYYVQPHSKKHIRITIEEGEGNERND